MLPVMTRPDPHANAAVLTAGEPLAGARAAMVMVHGRGATAESILALHHELPGEGFAFLAPQAEGQAWYPYSFLAPIQDNEPWLSSALAMLRRLIQGADEAGLSGERVMLLGFSQGACLMLEYAARNAARYGGLAALSGGLIGPRGTPREYGGSFESTPAFLGCSDVDPHVPLWRVEETDEVLTRMGAAVTRRIYPGMGHTINRDELDQVGRMMRTLTAEAARP
jgi:predicted esterase